MLRRNSLHIRLPFFSSSSIFNASSFPTSAARCSSSSLSSSATATAGPTYIPNRQAPHLSANEIRSHLTELAVRSASMREALREAVRAPSVEVGLRHFNDFLSLHSFSQNELSRLHEHGDLDRMRISLELFRAWYLQTKAPQMVQMSEPWTWFQKARMMRRRFVFHAGPTNSGKSYAAIERLCEAKSGVYAAPLKALASQVWLKINERRSCDLLIGDERQFGGGAEHVSCTVEMTPIELAVDVAVVDEVQLMADSERGWAWTRAILGLPAREIHLCGEERAVPLVRKLLWHTKEQARLEIRHHKRLVPLDLSPPLDGHLDRAESGDCFVCFSRKSIFETAAHLRQRLGHGAKVHVIYGGLPFAVREFESRAFNEGVEQQTDNKNKTQTKHLLVSTDAIAYGLNLSIRRIVFSTMRKFDGQSMTQLSKSSILQIAGRAGRFGTRFGDHGYATTLHHRDYATLEEVMTAGVAALPKLERAGLLPTADVLTVYSETVPQLSFCDMIRSFADKCTVTDAFFVCNMARSLIAIAETVDDVAMPSVADKILFCFAPMGSGDRGGLQFLRRLAVEHGQGGPVRIAAEFKECEQMELRVEESLRGDEKLKETNKHDNSNQNGTLSEELLLSVPKNAFVSAVMKFYAEHNPKKTEDVPALCDKYDRRHIIDQLKQKYGIGPSLPGSGGGAAVPTMHEQQRRCSSTQRGNHNNRELDELLRRCETLYRHVEVYGWLAWRFPKTFTELELSAQAKSKLVGLIDRLLKVVQP